MHRVAKMRILQIFAFLSIENFIEKSVKVEEESGNDCTDGFWRGGGGEGKR